MSEVMHRSTRISIDLYPMNSYRVKLNIDEGKKNLVFSIKITTFGLWKNQKHKQIRDKDHRQTSNIMVNGEGMNIE